MEGVKQESQGMGGVGRVTSQEREAWGEEDMNNSKEKHERSKTRDNRRGKHGRSKTWRSQAREAWQE